MIVLLKCVAESVSELGVRGLADLVPGGGYACDLASSVWRKYHQRRQVHLMRQDVQEIAASGVDQVRQAAAEAVQGVGPGLPPDQRQQLELFLAQMPAAVRRSLKRPEDVAGRSVPTRFALTGPGDVAGLLPDRLPRFRPGDPLIGKPGWSLTDLLGVGGFGEVWLARHASMTALAGAVKFCHPAHARELRHESTVINRVMDVGRGKPPNIVPLLDVNLDGDAPWLMYEYVAGGELTDLIRGLATRPPAARPGVVLGVLGQLCTAVAHFHQLRPPLVHRDLKPGNVLVDGSGRRVLVTDFGIGGAASRAALRGEAGATAAGRLATSLRGSYTPLYSSPEQRTGADPDPRDDVHAIGVIAYQLWTAQLTRGPGADYAHDLRDAGTPAGLIDLIGECVAGNPARRPADAAGVLVRLRSSGPSAPVSPAPPAPPAPAGSPVSMTAPVAGPATPAACLQAWSRPGTAAPGSPPPPVSPTPVAWPVLDDSRLAAVAGKAERVPAGSFGFQLEDHLPHRPPTPAALPAEIDASRTMLLIVGGVAVAGLGLVPVGLFTRGFVSAFGVLLVVVFGAWFGIARLMSPHQREFTRRCRAHAASCRDLEDVERAWADTLAAHTRRHRGGVAAGRDLAGRGRELVRAYALEQHAEGGRAAHAARDAEDAARRDYLRVQSIATADIPNIGESRKQALAAHGVRTAADINPRILNEVDGFGPALRNSLLAWKDDVARRFRFAPQPVTIDPARAAAVYARFRSEMDRLEAQADVTLNELLALEPSAKKTFAGLTPEVRRVAAEWSQTRADLRLARSIKSFF